METMLKRKLRDDDFVPLKKGQFTEKIKGKQPSRDRPEFKREQFDLAGL